MTKESKLLGKNEFTDGYGWEIHTLPYRPHQWTEYYTREFTISICTKQLVIFILYLAHK